MLMYQGTPFLCKSPCVTVKDLVTHLRQYISLVEEALYADKPSFK